MRLAVILLAATVASAATAAAPPVPQLLAFGSVAGNDVYAADLDDADRLRFSVRGLAEKKDRYGFWG